MRGCLSGRTANGASSAECADACPAEPQTERLLRSARMPVRQNRKRSVFCEVRGCLSGRTANGAPSAKSADACPAEPQTERLLRSARIVTVGRKRAPERACPVTVTIRALRKKRCVCGSVPLGEPVCPRTAPGLTRQCSVGGEKVPARSLKPAKRNHAVLRSRSTARTGDPSPPASLRGRAISSYQPSGTPWSLRFSIMTTPARPRTR